MLKQLQNKAAEGFETMWVHIEDSTDYETITVNIQKMLHIAENIGKEYEVMDYCLSYNGTYFEHGSTSNNVFIDEEECIIFCTNYLWELRDEEGETISLTEARREVLANSGKL